MHPEDLMKADLFSEIVLLATGGLIFVALLVIVVTALTRGYPRENVPLEDLIPPTIQVGTILIEGPTLLAQGLGLESEPYAANWSVAKVFDSFALDRKIHAAGWNFFFIAPEVKAMFFGALGANKIQNALERILEKVRPEH